MVALPRLFQTFDAGSIQPNVELDIPTVQGVCFAIHLISWSSSLTESSMLTLLLYITNFLQCQFVDSLETLASKPVC